jgi:hypothetical protein
VGSRRRGPGRSRWFTLNLDLPRGALAVVEHLPPYAAMADEIVVLARVRNPPRLRRVFPDVPGSGHALEWWIVNRLHLPSDPKVMLVARCGRCSAAAYGSARWPGRPSGRRASIRSKSGVISEMLGARLGRTCDETLVLEVLTS